jgi:GntR family transcriptional regulator, rspAB operon transcriptional repressor
MYESAMARQREKILPAQLERRVYERLLGEIIAGALAPGEQLVEARIAEELGVSKTPVREALIRLQRDGLVEIEPYRGARVVEPSEGDVAEILEVRLCIESYIAADLARRRPGWALAAMERSVERSREAFGAGDQGAFLESLREFDTAFAQGCENSRMVRVLGEIRNVLELIGHVSLRAPGREARSLVEHEEILLAIQAGDPAAAAAAIEAHIRSIERDSHRPRSVEGVTATAP